MKLRYLVAIFLISTTNLSAQLYSEKMAATARHIWGDTINLRPGNPMQWTYERGVILKGFEYLWYNTGNPLYYNTIKKSMDAFLDNNGNITDYSPQDYNIDNVLCGRSLLTLYKVTNDTNYYHAATLLRNQLRSHPRTKEGGFWHKKRYEWQMWLDGLYMAEPFYAEYAATFHEDSAFNDITNQFVWMEKHARDAKTGLLYHGWDESKRQRWANKTTGVSPNVWARAMGWYGMALVDVLQYFPANNVRKKELLAILKRFADASIKVQDPTTGLWWNIMDKPHYKTNYLEASASSMLVYTLAKAVRNGWLPTSYLASAVKGYSGIIKQFISSDSAGNINLEGTVSVSGLGGNADNYRDGSFDYYMSEKVVQNDPKGVGAFIQCAAEMEMLTTQKIGAGKRVAVDLFFNNEKKKDITGTEVQFHYVWDEMDNNGFSILGHTFNKYGVQTTTLAASPNAANLSGKDFYIIVDPDNKHDNPNPNYVTEKAASAVYDWVKKGGVLLLLANDSANCDLAHFNKLSEKFGISFTNQSANMVKGQEYKTGEIIIGTPNEIFSKTKKVYLKEISVLSVVKPAVSLISKEENCMMAIAKVGKGAVFATGDPWLYNEYTDGRKIPAEYQNFSAANELVEWMIKMSKNKVAK